MVSTPSQKIAPIQTEPRQIHSALDLGLRGACVVTDALPVIAESLLLMSVPRFEKKMTMCSQMHLAQEVGEWAGTEEVKQDEGMNTTKSVVIKAQATFRKLFL